MLIVHSPAMNAFLTRVRTYARDILSQEMKLTVHRRRVQYQNLLIPFSLVLFEDATRLGFFCAENYTIGLHKKLIYAAKADIIKDLLRHELAHFYAYLENGMKERPHDQHYREVCQRFWPNQTIASAKMDLEKENDRLEGDLPAERLMSKIKKLWALGNSDNPHEAELATLKANALLLEHNLEMLKDQVSVESDEDILYQKSVLKFSRVTGKYSAIHEILQNFFVAPVLCHNPHFTTIDVCGNRTNVEVAEHVALFLDQELDRLWESAQKIHELKGPTAKNSFMRGISHGYGEKIKGQQQTMAESTALIKIHGNLQKKLALAFPRMGHRYTTISNFDYEAQWLGEEHGRKLTVQSAIKNHCEKKSLLEFWKN